MSNKTDNRGMRYMFASFVKDRGWMFVGRSFEISNGKRGEVCGQFISSNWFSQVYTFDESQRYMIIGLNKNSSGDLRALEKIINSLWPSPLLVQQLNKEEKEFGIEFKDIYIMENVKDGVKERKNGESWTITLNGVYGYSQLHINARIIDDEKLYMTLPDFNSSC